MSGIACYQTTSLQVPKNSSRNIGMVKLSMSHAYCERCMGEQVVADPCYNFVLSRMVGILHSVGKNHNYIFKVSGINESRDLYVAVDITVVSLQLSITRKYSGAGESGLPKLFNRRLHLPLRDHLRAAAALHRFLPLVASFT